MPQNAVSDQALYCLHTGCVKEMMTFIIRMSGSALLWRIETGQIFFPEVLFGHTFERSRLITSKSSLVL